MERIGIAASKIAKGSLGLYNFYVILFSFLISVLLLLVSGTFVFVGIFFLRLLSRPFLPTMHEGLWDTILGFCLISLTVIVAVLNLGAISKNIKLK